MKSRSPLTGAFALLLGLACACGAQTFSGSSDEALGSALAGLFSSNNGSAPVEPVFGPLELKLRAKHAKPNEEALISDSTENLLAAGKALAIFPDDILSA